MNVNLPILHRRRSAILLILLGAMSQFSAKATGEEQLPARLSPSGFRGTLIATLADSPSPEVVARLKRGIPQPEAQVVVILLGNAEGDATVKALSEVTKRDVVSIRVEDKAAANDKALLNACTMADAMVVLSSATENDVVEQLPDSVLSNQIRSLLDRRGIFVLCGPSAKMIGGQYVNRTSGKTQSGMQLLPDFCLTVSADDAQAAEKLLDSLPGKIGCSLPATAALCVSGRDISALDGAITLRLAKTNAREARRQEVTSQRPVDYNEWVRAARGRAGIAYPPDEVATPEVPSGALVIIGGGGMPAEIGRKFVELGGGEEGRFVVLPTAQPDPLPLTGEGSFLKRFGAKHITVISAREQGELETPENLKTLEEATGIWFGGGRQWRFMDAYEGTKYHALFQDVLKRGGVIGGSSAGATIQGDYLVRGAPAGPHIMMCEGYERGLGFLPGTAIDQHFTQRKRQPDMTAMMKAYPQYLGIGLDEATAIVVRGHVAEVMGQGAVHFYDRRKELSADQPDYEVFRQGESYDLKERRHIPKEPNP